MFLFLKFDLDKLNSDLLYYLKVLKTKGVIRKGKLEFAEKNKKDKKIIIIELTDEVEKELDKYISPYENAYYVVVTRGHLGDSACARAILKRPFAYFGMIGSRTKVRITREKLLKEGFTEEQLDQIHAPIGLPIGGQMPAEIAVSIMAEIVQEKNRHFRTYCDEEVEAAVRRRTPGTMVTIIEKKGSSPRGTGSKMFVFRDGSTAGSIGGGKVEFEAGKHAVNIRNTETKVYELGQGAGDLGMICGGTVRVLFEPVNM